MASIVIDDVGPDVGAQILPTFPVTMATVVAWTVLAINPWCDIAARRWGIALIGVTTIILLFPA
jgi:hypothetical protein